VRISVAPKAFYERVFTSTLGEAPAGGVATQLEALPTPARAASPYTASAVWFVSDRPSRKAKAPLQIATLSAIRRFMQFYTLYSPTNDAEFYACSFPARQARIMLLKVLPTTVSEPGCTRRSTVGYKPIVRNALLLCASAALPERSSRPLV
jgi:hypothetical protein